MEPSQPSPNSISRRNFLGLAAMASAAASVAGGAGCTTNAGAAPAQTPKNDETPFPKDFQWGVATSSYQIEGGAFEDGKGLSVWDTFCKQKDKIFEGQTGEVACDHYHRYKEDVALMKEMGAKSYRFSVSWPRVLPDGVGKVNEKGVDFYKRVLDELQAAGISPMCTIFHWDYPEALQQRGGWVKRESADWFAEYTGALADHLGDRIKTWVTQNEPQCFIGQALQAGIFAPGLKLPYDQYLMAAHNGMRAHAKSVQVLRAKVKGAQIGYVLAAQCTRPFSDSPADIEAARKACFSVFERHPWNNAWWSDPVLLGKYPESGLKFFGSDVPKFADSDLTEMKVPIDFLGLNIYKADTYKSGPDGAFVRCDVPPGYPRSAVVWQPITPDSMYWGCKYFWDRYKLPLSLTENGLSTRDQVFLDGKVHDPQRIDFMHRYLRELQRAMKEGIPVSGYYAWSLLDNFEWADGYRERFGLVYVDFGNQKRIPKDSFEWYKRVIESNGKLLFEPTTMPIDQVTAG